MQTLSLAEKATPSHVAPDRPSKCIPITFSLVHPDHCCSLHSPGTFLSQSFGTCYFLSLPCSSLFRLTPPFIQAPAPMPLLQIGCFCSPCLKQHPLILFALYSAFLILETLSWPHITEYFIWGRLGEWLWAQTGEPNCVYILALPLPSCVALDKWFYLSVLQSLPL